MNLITQVKELITNPDLDKIEIYRQLFGDDIQIAYDTARRQLKGIENFLNLLEDSDSSFGKLSELQSERIKIQTEKAEFARMLREQSRADLTEEKIVNAIRSTYKNYSVPKINFIPKKVGGTSMVLGISDLHYGAEFKICDLVGQLINEYNPEICEQRMWKILDDIVRYAEKNNIKEVTIFNLGDGIEGLLHISQLLILRYGVIESVAYLSSFILKWIITLSQYMRVNYKQVRDNHSDMRLITGKKGDFPHENLSLLTIWHLRELIEMKQIPNITVQGYNDEGNVYCNVGGFDVLAVHGHNEGSSLAKSLKDYSMLYSNNNIDYLLAGHLHYGACEDVSIGKEVVRFPSVMGGNDYSVKNKKISDAGAKILLLENGVGITDEHRIKF
jgi:hypothetical protein